MRKAGLALISSVLLVVAVAPVLAQDNAGDAEDTTASLSPSPVAIGSPSPLRVAPRGRRPLVVRKHRQDARETVRERQQEVRDERRAKLEKLRAKRRELAEKRREKVSQLKRQAFERVQAAREKFRNHLQEIRDQKKQQILKHLDQRYANINERWTNYFLRVLDRLEAILDKLQVRAETRAANGADTTQALQAIADARAAIADARSAVETQAAKVYTMEITDETGLREDAHRLHRELRSDLFDLRKTVRQARQKVIDVFRALGSVSNQPEE